ncbi:Gfo/Idh/MocA family oxidoreductase, partial [Photobacterium leiognathi]|uniref:Gfo/Idh/MocA family oxidoreductase n=1 Tax=Photobacterium leiognathi TaxID=553611 RepID=UPI00298266D1
MYSVIKDRKIRIAIVGCGRISKNHFGSIETLNSEYELVAICDNNPEVLEHHTNQYGVPGYLSIDELLVSESLDLVS